ncbi:hypothetical protein [Kineococcus sp. SYSU DK003]|uniref:hypothetical protein n=1 Tax=Kineococcus sp. SYSU DK003 TaxID=3383124 RepID=UPI003D7EA1E4
MSEQTPLDLVGTRVLRGRQWRAQQLDAAAGLEVQLRTEAAARGLVLDQVSDLEVVVDDEGTSAHVTRTATAHRR